MATNTGGVIDLKLSVSGKPAPHIVVLGTKPRSAVASCVDHFTILGVLPAPVQGLSNLTDLFVAKYGVQQPGLRVFLQTLQQINAWESVPEQISAIVPATQSIPRPDRQEQAG